MVATDKLLAFSARAIASSVVLGVALDEALRHPKQSLHVHAVFASFEPSRASITLARLHQLAYESFPLWSQDHPRDTCPRTIEELAAYTNSDVRGPYGGEATYSFTCDPRQMPPGVRAIWLRAPGEDGVPDTADDFTSDMTEGDLE